MQIISEVRQRRPATRLVLLTAYGSKEIEEQARARGVDVLLHKPKPLAEIGIKHSNFRMVLNCRPDYFKIDRYLVEGCREDY